MKKLSTLALTMSIGVLSACSNNTAETSTTPEIKADTSATATKSTTTEATTDMFGKMPSKEKAKASYVVISQSSYPPFAFRDEKGNATGLDIDMLSVIGEKQNIHFEFIANDMTGLLESVNTGKADIVATGVNITPERQALYDFSKPYMQANWVVLLNGAKGEKITDFNQLKDKPIAVQKASLSETQLQSTQITNNTVPVKTVFLGLSAIAQDKAVGVYDVDSVLDTYIKPDNQLYTVVDKKSGTIPFGFVVKKGNTVLKDILDKGIDDIKADGTYDKIYQKWYPNVAPTQVNMATTASSAQ